MAKYDVTYSCGHTDTIQLFGKERDRQWRLSREEEKLCPECYQKKLEEDRQKMSTESAEANQMAGLPPLQGTEKQITWAETIRKRIVDILDRRIKDHIGAAIDATPDYKEKYEKCLKAFESIKQHSQAFWWINNRHFEDNRIDVDRLLNQEYQMLLKAESQPPQSVIEAAQAEATVYPKNQMSNLVAEITVRGNVLRVYYPQRCEDFRDIMRKHGFVWNNGWERKINEYSGPIEDRAAEIGNKLLTHGYPIRIYDTETRRRAISGEYEPERVRWVKVMSEGEYQGWFSLTWPYEHDLYEAAKRIPGARWHERKMLVPSESFAELVDFTEMYHFSITEGALVQIEKAKQFRDAALVADVIPGKDAVLPKGSTKPPKINVPEDVDIDDEFRD